MLGCWGPRAAGSGHTWGLVTGTAFALRLQLEGGPSWSRTKSSHRKDWPERWVVALGVEQVWAASPRSWETLLVRNVWQERRRRRRLERAGHAHRPDNCQGSSRADNPLSGLHAPPNPHSWSQGPCSFPISELGGQVFFLCLIREFFPSPRPGLRPSLLSVQMLSAPVRELLSTCTNLTPDPAGAGGGGEGGAGRCGPHPQAGKGEGCSTGSPRSRESQHPPGASQARGDPAEEPVWGRAGGTHRGVSGL